MNFGENAGFFFQAELQVSCETASSLKVNTMYLISSRRVAETEKMDKVVQREHKEEK